MKRMFLVIVALVVTALFLGTLGCATTQPQSQLPAQQVVQSPPSGAVIAERPTYKIGDEWTLKWRNGLQTIRVAELKEKVIITTKSDKPSSYREIRDADFNLVEVQGSVNPITTGFPFFHFPLFVGKIWGKIVMTSARGESSYCRHDAKVIGYEEVTVPAGKFKAFKIVHRQSTDKWSGELIHWYSPIVKAPVKVTSKNFRYPPDCELVSYQLVAQ